MNWKDWEGVLIIGGLALVLGAVLLVPALVWVRKARQDPAAFGAGKVGRGLLAFVAIFVAVQLIALAAPIWTPNSEFGQWMSTDSGRLIFAAAAFVAVLLLGALLVLAIYAVDRARRAGRRRAG